MPSSARRSASYKTRGCVRSLGHRVSPECVVKTPVGRCGTAFAQQPEAGQQTMVRGDEHSPTVVPPPQQTDAPVQIWPDGQEGSASLKRLWRQTSAPCVAQTHACDSLHDGSLLEPHAATRAPTVRRSQRTSRGHASSRSYETPRAKPSLVRRTSRSGRHWRMQHARRQRRRLGPPRLHLARHLRHRGSRERCGWRLLRGARVSHVHFLERWRRRLPQQQPHAVPGSQRDRAHLFELPGCLPAGRVRSHVRLDRPSAGRGVPDQHAPSGVPPVLGDQPWGT